MTSRERLLAAFHGELPDRLPWAPEFNIVFCDRILQDIPGSPYTEHTKYIEACRRMRAECFLRVDAVEVTHPNVEVTDSREGDLITHTYATPLGTLASRARMIDEIGTEMEFEHMVRTADDVRAYRFIYDDAVYRPRYDFVREQISHVADSGLISVFGGGAPRRPPTAWGGGYPGALGVVAGFGRGWGDYVGSFVLWVEWGGGRSFGTFLTRRRFLTRGGHFRRVEWR